MIIRQITDDVYLFTDTKIGFSNNVSVIFTKEGPVIIDVFRDKDQFNEIMNFIKSKGYEAPNTIIYTHWHTDHTCGNRTKFEKCNVIAHQATYEHLESFINNDLDRMKRKKILESDVNIIMPDHTFKNELLISISGKSMKLIHCPGHTYDSIIIHDIEDNILIAGDNLVGGEIPFVMPPSIPPDEIDSNSKDLDNAYKLIESINAQVIIPGHGEVTEPGLMIETNKKRYNKCLQEGLLFLD